MANVEISAVIHQLRGVLREAFEGPAQQQWSYFTDQGKDAGMLRTLATIDAPEASRVPGRYGTSIAAHAYHATFALNASAAWIRGERTPRNWRESWRVSTVDEPAWGRLREDLRRGYEDLSEAIGSSGASSEEAVGGAIGAIAHAAYHLGAIRQKLALLPST